MVDIYKGRVYNTKTGEHICFIDEITETELKAILDTDIGAFKEIDNIINPKAILRVARKEGITAQKALEMLRDKAIDLEFELKEQEQETQNSVKYGGM